ncbi:uncharacterized protein C8A04DRAFT_32733 [Dichotomopilus funicola]|uniref:BTB domain-containing protein n=1 Tax=Dichotomopilus funicola TaxID=1934379 RepID=A0AAN6UVG8_9PEZI|nr:hypothetical protein C8A04DRAFT_32733 [Dichotomopilus funicola]
MGVVTWKDISTSKVYRFLIGSSKREFTVHSAVVEGQSDAFNTLVNNTAFREANDGCAELEEVDEGVFASFVQYVYTGDYDFPDHGMDPVTGRKPGLEVALAALHSPVNRGSSYRGIWEDEETPTPEPSQPPPDDSLMSQLFRDPEPGLEDDPQGSGSDSSDTTASMFDPTANTARPLLHHARLYVFADCYQISRLAQIAHDNLEKQLGALKQKPFDRISVDVTITLLAYAYQEPRPKALRSLLVQDVSRKVDKLWIYGSFREIPEAHAELGAELVGEMAKRLRSS